jgi:hypothetical protein
MRTVGPWATVICVQDDFRRLAIGNGHVEDDVR